MTQPTVEEIIAKVKRFRILTVGGSGVGKSSLINCVFKVEKAQVSHYKPGEADIYQEITSDENLRFVCHDSKGFEPASLETFQIVEEFIKDKTAESLELSERLHAIWLCIKTPTAGARVIEAGQEKILRLVHNIQIPIVIVFTQYDRVSRTKSDAEAQNILNGCLDSLQRACEQLGIREMPSHIHVSSNSKHEKNTKELADLTAKIVQEKLPGHAWIIWAMAQRKSVPLKVELSISTSLDYYIPALLAGNTPNIPGHGKILLRECLYRVHTGIVDCWNFRPSDPKILNSDTFKQMMLFIVEDINLEQTPGIVSKELNFERLNEFLGLISGVAGTLSISIAPPLAVLGLSYAFYKWLQRTVTDNVPDVQRILMAYTIDLTLILQRLLKITLAESHKGEPSWTAVHLAFEEYQGREPGSALRLDVVHDEIRSIVARLGKAWDRDKIKIHMDTLMGKYGDSE